VRKDHRPAWLKHLLQWLSNAYCQWRIAPQLDSLGAYPHIVGPQHLIIFGPRINIGSHLHMACDSDRKVRLICWPTSADSNISIGDYCLIAPGVKIQAAQQVHIGDSCMFGADASISDSDWHGVYNRLRPFGRATQPITIADNVWVGERAIITKGVTIGENSIVGAGAVVTKDVPANTIVAGNPAKIVKEINPNRRKLTRQDMFKDWQKFTSTARELDRYVMAENSLLKWLLRLVVPNKKS